MSDDRKQIHLNLMGDQLIDYEFARRVTGIMNDNDLLRHLLRQFRIERPVARTLIDTPAEYHARAEGE